MSRTLKHLYNSVFISVLMVIGSATLASEPLLKATTSWDGAAISYPAGAAEITSILLSLPAGKAAPWHCHPVPTFGFVKKGRIEVETRSGDKTVLLEGESAVEVMKSLHRGTAIDGPAEIIVFYAGAVGIPTTVMADDPLAEKYCR
ncbi:cupin domain-containing protein [Gilvimarinus sp. SDUM040013]|uniref:Cupin domain-containing protein n=1 Tax=Gilvimarinus gilvus TaxID=3058038 RepID=A0ABU4S1T5_9GAMM|nr:cupin domain-containing protein [Gilvimarinus sp. SDUM040013]MDO3385470.1 cupin domain-containing protein [Gilvimarinus sp. SDUM040013]MDX6851113.1 cupin domain-containing protein [Gilvimarinus sp. SDUM040013]